MNSESTAKGPFEQDNRYLGDWLCEHERRQRGRERRLRWFLALAVAFGVACGASVWIAG